MNQPKVLKDLRGNIIRPRSPKTCVDCKKADTDYSLAAIRCKECAEKARRLEIKYANRGRICEDCGSTDLATPRRILCDPCAKERKRQQQLRYMCSNYKGRRGVACLDCKVSLADKPNNERCEPCAKAHNQVMRDLYKPPARCSKCGIRTKRVTVCDNCCPAWMLKRRQRERKKAAT